MTVPPQESPPTARPIDQCGRYSWYVVRDDLYGVCPGFDWSVGNQGDPTLTPMVLARYFDND